MSGPQLRWGWHRLADAWAERLVVDARVGPRDLAIDVGAGAGAITGALVHHGARVIAVELHHGRAAALRRRFRAADVTVVQVDCSGLRLPRRPFHVVANPPFASLVALLRRLTAPGSQLIRADLVVPRHVADRWVWGNPPGAGRWRRQFTCSIGRVVPPSAFSPPSTQPTCVLVLQRRSHFDAPATPRPLRARGKG